MSSDDLQRYEDMANDYRYEGSIFKPIVLKLVEEVRRLQKECEEWKGFALYD